MADKNTGSPRPRVAFSTEDAASSAAELGRPQEWLLDEALKETFPASDPISPAMPSKRHDENASSRGE
jgi:hypothetical protein